MSITATCSGCGQGENCEYINGYLVCDRCACDFQDDDEYDDDPKGYCDTCNNTGYLDCHCGGDLCVCGNQGEYDCPDCGGY